MEPEETTDELEVETQDESVEEEQDPEGDDTQDTQALTDAQKLAKATAEANKWRRLFEKSKRGTTPEGDEHAETPTQSVDVEEVVLKAQGMAPALLSELKLIAKLRDVSLIDAQSDDLFVAVKEEFEKDARTKKANMGASRGSGAQQVKKTLATPQLSREEHMKLVKGR